MTSRRFVSWAVLIGISLSVLLAPATVAQTTPSPAAKAANSPEGKRWANDYNATMNRFRDEMRVIAARPDPPKTGRKGEKLDALKTRFDAFAGCAARSVRAVDALKMPAILQRFPVFVELQVASRKMLDDSATDCRRIAVTLGRRDKAASEAAGRRFDKNLRANQQRLLTAMSELARVAPASEQARIREVQRKLGQPAGR